LIFFWRLSRDPSNFLSEQNRLNSKEDEKERLNANCENVRHEEKRD
jgi:hypothetical protein